MRSRKPRRSHWRPLRAARRFDVVLGAGRGARAFGGKGGNRGPAPPYSFSRLEGEVISGEGTRFNFSSRRL